MLGERLNKYTEIVDKLKYSNIYGCITGSTLLASDTKDNGEEEPDIDVYVYNEHAWIDAVNKLRYMYGFGFGVAYGTKEDEKLNKGKFEQFIKTGFHKKLKMNTIKLNRDGITVNVSVKKDRTCAMDIITDFDMTIIMIAGDIRGRYYIDLSKGPDGTLNPNVGYPNPYRDVDYSVYNASYYVRQFDRVIKYYNRGYNTIPTAKHYVHIIDEALEAGKMFESEAFKEKYNEFSEEYLVIKDKILKWIEDKEDDYV